MQENIEKLPPKYQLDVLLEVENQMNLSRVMKFYDTVDKDNIRHIYMPVEMVKHNEKFYGV